jgi:hypothetical protein
LDVDVPKHTARLSAISTGTPERMSRRCFEIIGSQAIGGYYTSAEVLRELDYKGKLVLHGVPRKDIVTQPHALGL